MIQWFYQTTYRKPVLILQYGRPGRFMAKIVGCGKNNYELYG